MGIVVDYCVSWWEKGRFGMYVLVVVDVLFQLLDQFGLFGDCCFDQVVDGQQVE